MHYAPFIVSILDTLNMDHSLKAKATSSPRKSLITKYSKWGMLDSVGLTEDMLLSILLNNSVVGLNVPDIEAPTYGVLMELYQYTSDVSDKLERKQNRLLKLLVDTLFPMCSIGRADRLERKIASFCSLYQQMPIEERVLFLQTQWRPQPTGKSPLFVYVLCIENCVTYM